MPLKLPRLPRDVPLVTADGKASFELQKWWNSLCNTIESHEAYQDAILAAQTAADAANAAAAAADAAAIAAQGAADDASAVAAITNSGVSGVTITGTDAGASATVNITAHTRIYGDGTIVAVNSGSVTTLSYSTLYYIYYDQPSRAGGAVTYVATTSQTTAAQTGDRHLVGQVTTPAAAAPDTGGDYVGAPGLGNMYL